MTRNAARPRTVAPEDRVVADLGHRLLAEADRVGRLAVVVADERRAGSAPRHAPARALRRRSALEDRVRLDDLGDVDEQVLGGERGPASASSGQGRRRGERGRRS